MTQELCPKCGKPRHMGFCEEEKIPLTGYERTKRWRKNNREKVNEQMRNYRRRKRDKEARQRERQAYLDKVAKEGKN